MATQKTIFALTVIECWDEKPKYPKFDTHEHIISYFSSLIKAEQGILKYIKGRYGEKIFGFEINEYVLDEYSYWAEPKSWRTYLSDGSLWDESTKPSMWYENGKPLKEYNAGRPAEKVRFKVGDLVEVRNSEKVWLGRIIHLPYTPEEVQQDLEYLLKTYPDITGVPDEIDAGDYYYLIDELGYHDHPVSPCRVFPARLKIGKKLREQLNNAKPL